MATYTQVVEGLKILSQYEDPDSHSIQAEHDIIYSGPDHEDLPADDLKKLEELGWIYDGSTDSWMIYV